MEVIMHKQLLLLSLAFPFVVHGMLNFPVGVTLKQVQAKVASKQVIIAWDIHGVLAKKSTSSKIKSILKNLPSIVTSKITKNKAWKEIENLPKELDVSGEGYAEIFKKHGEYELAKMIAEVANAYKPRKGMPFLIQELNLLGFTQRYASNIGNTFLNNLNTKFKKKYKTSMLDHILPGKVVDYSKYGKKPLPHPLPPHLASTPKPHVTFFQEFIDTWNPKQDKIVIFIDDKITNIKTAISKGYVGVYMHTKWDDDMFVKQLRGAFKSLGLYGKK